MNISTKGIYGIRAMLDLALHEGSSPVKRKDIARRQQIPEAYLVQLISLLRKHGLVKTARGPSGGHLLGRPAAHVTLKMVLDALEGVEEDRSGKETGSTTPWDQERDFLLLGIWDQIQHYAQELLEATTLESLAKEMRKKDQAIIYHI